MRTLPPPLPHRPRLDQPHGCALLRIPILWIPLGIVALREDGPLDGVDHELGAVDLDRGADRRDGRAQTHLDVEVTGADVDQMAGESSARSLARYSDIFTSPESHQAPGVLLAFPARRVGRRRIEHPRHLDHRDDYVGRMRPDLALAVGYGAHRQAWSDHRSTVLRGGHGADVGNLTHVHVGSAPTLSILPTGPMSALCGCDAQLTA